MTKEKIIAHGFNLMALGGGDVGALDAMLASHVEAGCSHVELTGRQLDMIVGGRINEHRAETVKAILQKHKLSATLHAHHALNFMDIPNFDMHQAVALASIELAHQIGISSIVIHSGRAPLDVWESSSKRLLEIERDAFKMLGDRAGQVGTRIAVENLIVKPDDHLALYGADPRALREQIEAIAHPSVGGCLDFGHAFLSAPVVGFDFADAVSDYSECVWHLHLHDNCGIPSAGKSAALNPGDRVALGVGDLHLPIGWGHIPWAEILPRMHFQDGVHAMIELECRYRADEAKVAETAKVFADYWNGELSLKDVHSFLPKIKIKN